MARLRVIGGAELTNGQTEIVMKTDAFHIGRKDSSDLKLNSKRVSREHVEIRYNQSTSSFTIYDLNSANGTKVNNEFFKSTSRPLGHDATIEIGPVTLQFEILSGHGRGRPGLGSDDESTQVD